MNILEKMMRGGREILQGLSPRVAVPPEAFDAPLEDSQNEALAEIIKDRLTLFFTPIINAMNVGSVPHSTGAAAADPKRRSYYLTIARDTETDGSPVIVATIAHLNAAERAAQQELGTGIQAFSGEDTASNGITRAVLESQSQKFFAPLENGNRTIFLSSFERKNPANLNSEVLSFMGPAEIIVNLQNKFPEAMKKLNPLIVDGTLASLRKILNTPIQIELPRPQQ